MVYRKEIDGLRAIALLPVIFYHAGFKKFSGAFVMVDVFFVISGYLISSLILAELETNSFSLLRFYERRARRILPALFWIMLISLPCAWIWLAPSDLIGFAKSVGAACLFSSNFLFWQESGYFSPGNDLKPLIHTWSLAAEEQFYLIFPFVLSLAWKWKRKGALFLAIGISILSLGIMQWGTLNSPDATFYLLPGRAWEFLIGMLVALFMDSITEKTRSNYGLLDQLLSLIGGALLINSLFTFNSYQPFPSLRAILPLIGTALIIIFATPRTLLGKLLSLPPLVGIGIVSYSGYLWHQPLFAFARNALLAEPAPRVFATLIALNFILAFLTWKYIEQPFRKRSCLSQKQIFNFSAATSIVFVSLALIVIIKNGFPTRYPVFDLKMSSILEASTKDQAFVHGKRRPQYHSKDTSLDRFISDWKGAIDSPSSFKTLPIAMYGSSHGADIHAGLERLGYKAYGIFGSGCHLDPADMSAACRKLAEILSQYIRSHPQIHYLALIEWFQSEWRLSLPRFQRIIDFWRPLNVKILIFSEKPHCLYFKERLEKGIYPEPNLHLADYSLRPELRTYLSARDVTLVDTKQIFCNISGDCDFKIGPKNQFRAENFIVFDGHHLTANGQKEFARILIQNDPLFKAIVQDEK